MIDVFWESDSRSRTIYTPDEISVLQYIKQSLRTVRSSYRLNTNILFKTIISHKTDDEQGLNIVIGKGKTETLAPPHDLLCVFLLGLQAVTFYSRSITCIITEASWRNIGRTGNPTLWQYCTFRWQLNCRLSNIRDVSAVAKRSVEHVADYTISS